MHNNYSYFTYLPALKVVKKTLQLKKEITEDITAALTSVISTAVANVKPQLPTPPPQFHHYSRKCKPDKRIRKGPAAHVPENSSE